MEFIQTYTSLLNWVPRSGRKWFTFVISLIKLQVNLKLTVLNDKLFVILLNVTIVLDDIAFISILLRVNSI